MSDIFSEVDEEVRRERLKRLWDRYGIFVVALAVFIVIGVSAWRLNVWWETKKAAASGVAFEAAALLGAQGKNAEAEAAFAKIAADGHGGYRILARLREAAELSGRDAAAAVKIYDGIVAGPGIAEPLRDLAAVRAAMILVDGVPYEDIRRRLEPLTVPERAFRHTARELLALSAWRASDSAALRRWSDMMTTDAATPSGSKARVDMLLVLSGAGGKS